MKLKTLCQITSLCCCLTLQLQCQVLAESLMEEATRYYNEANFGKAGKCLEAEIKANPNDAHAHYLLGNIFVELSRQQEAEKEYRHALKLEPHGTTAQYCQSALAGLEHHVAPPSASGLTTTSPNSAVNSSSSGLSGSVSSGHPDKQNPELNAMKNSASKISAQTNETETHTNEETEARIRYVTKDAERQISDLQREQQERIDANVPVYGRRGVKTYDPGIDNDAIRDEINHRIELVKEQQAKKIAQLRLTSKERQSAAEDSALTIDKEYVKNDQSSRFKLVPTGTNIYVRSYQTTDEPSGSRVPVALPPAKSLSGINNTSVPLNKGPKQSQ